MLSSLDLFVKEMKKLDDGSELVVYDESNAKIGLKLKLNELSMFPCLAVSFLIFRFFAYFSWYLLGLVASVESEERNRRTLEHDRRESERYVSFFSLFSSLGYRIYLPRGEIVFLPNHSKDSTLHSLTQKLAEKKYASETPRT